MYIILDWAGNELTKHGNFKTFQEAWDYIYQNFKESDFQDLSVEKRG